MKTEVPREVIVRGEPSKVKLPSVVRGNLRLEPSDGPMNCRSYHYPEFVKTTFEFKGDGDGECFRYTQDMPVTHLWLPAGSVVLDQVADFESNCMVFAGMRDDREVWHYLDSTGNKHECRLNYTGFRMELSPTESSFTVKCRYYDQTIGGEKTIYYEFGYEQLLLLPEHILSLDANGEVEDILAFFGGNDVVVDRFGTLPDVAKERIQAAQERWNRLRKK